MNEPTIQQFRIEYSKGEVLRYTANLDMHKIWERWFRRASVPLAYSKGYHPQPRINQAAPLPLGMLSHCELLDFWTETDSVCDVRDLVDKLHLSPQPGIDIHTLVEIHEKQASLQSRLRSMEYLAEPLFPIEERELEAKVIEFIKAEQIMTMRRDKEINLRPLVLSLSTTSAGGANAIFMHLQALPGASGRPDDVIGSLGFDPAHFRYTRTKIHLDN
jgi:radical SAM-linked protein